MTSTLQAIFIPNSDPIAGRRGLPALRGSAQPGEPGKSRLHRPDRLFQLAQCRFDVSEVVPAAERLQFESRLSGGRGAEVAYRAAKRVGRALDLLPIARRHSGSKALQILRAVLEEEPRDLAQHLAVSAHASHGGCFIDGGPKRFL